jgi:hypothetical protein
MKQFSVWLEEYDSQLYQEIFGKGSRIGGLAAGIASLPMMFGSAQGAERTGPAGTVPVRAADTMAFHRTPPVQGANWQSAKTLPSSQFKQNFFDAGQSVVQIQGIDNVDPKTGVGTLTVIYPVASPQVHNNEVMVEKIKQDVIKQLMTTNKISNPSQIKFRSGSKLDWYKDSNDKNQYGIIAKLLIVKR